MNIIDEKVKVLEDLQINQDQIILEMVKDIEDLILDLNTEQLNEKGIDGEGELIEPSYRPLTVTIKRQKGQPIDRVTLKDTGDFHDAFFVSYGSGYFVIGSDDPKAAKLEKKYGKDIYGLIDENIQEIIDQLRPELLNEIKTRL